MAMLSTQAYISRNGLWWYQLWLRYHVLIFHKDSMTELEPTNTWRSKPGNSTAFVGILLQVFQRMDSHKGTAGKKEQFSERLSILTRFIHTDWGYTPWLQNRIVYQYFSSFEELYPTFYTWMWWSKGALANKVKVHTCMSPHTSYGILPEDHVNKFDISANIMWRFLLIKPKESTAF